MKIVPICDIVLPPDRFRREFPEDAKRALAASIKADTLLHPIVVRELADGTYELVAGERRYRAVQELDEYYHNGEPVPRGHIPVTTLGEILDPAALRAQVSENVARLDFSWQERAEAFAALHRIRLEETNNLQPKVRTVGEIVKSRPVTVADVAELTTSLLVVDHLTDPEVAKAKSLREAEAIVMKRKQAEHDARIAEVVKKNDSPHRVYLGTCEVELLRMADHVFDVIIADPLYGINAHKHAPASGSESGYKHQYDDSPEAAARMWHYIFYEGYRIAKPRAHLYMFCDFSKWYLLVEMAAAAGWEPWPRPIIWDKTVGGMIGDYKHGPQRAYETVLFANKGQREVLEVAQELVRVTNDADTSLNAAAKPVGLYVDLIKRSARPGDTVLDPCCGTGPVFPAANRLALYATGIEASEVLYNRCLTRLEEK